MTSKLFEHPFDLGELSLMLLCGKGHSLTRNRIPRYTITVKVRLQSQPTDRPPAFHGPLDCFKQTFAKEGARGLYRVSFRCTLRATFQLADGADLV